MKICFIIHCTSFHGANRSLLDLIEGLRQYGVVPVVFCPGYGKITEEMIKRKIVFSVFPFRNWMTNHKKNIFLVGLMVMTINILLIPVMVMKAKKAKIDLVYSNSSCTLMGLLIAKVMGIPHIWHVREFGTQDFNLHPVLGRDIFECVIDKSDAIIAVSKSVRWKVLGRMNKKVDVVYNGVFDEQDIQRLQTERDMRMRQRQIFTFCIMGQISYMKNQEEAIRAFALLHKRNSHTNLIIVGDNNNVYGKKLRSLCRELELQDFIIFHGYEPNPFNILSSVDAFLMCSSWEASGRVTAEAMASGIPVIGFRNGGTVELIEDGIKGFLYEDGYVDLARKMEYVLTHPDVSSVIALAGQEKALKQFTIQVYAAKIWTIIMRVHEMKINKRVKKSSL